MIRVYDASNTIEAHLILNLLEQQGLNARIDGEYLQGGMGELPAAGTLRVMVDESDYEQAKTIVDDWDAKASSETDGSKEQRNKKTTGIGSFLCGGIVFGAIVVWYYQSPTYSDGLDYNKDGVLDEKWYYRKNTFLKSEIDSNLDGKIDLIYHANRAGIIDRAVVDQDFNNTFETRETYRHGMLYSIRSDTNDDGFDDMRTYVNADNSFSIEIFDSATKEVVKREFYDAFKIKYSEYDSDRDGVMDTKYEYDEAGEITSTQKIPQ